VLADAVLLHVTREQFVDVLQRARQAVADGGVMAVTLKEGGRGGVDGAHDMPKREDLPAGGQHCGADCRLMPVGEVPRAGELGRGVEPWLFVLARTWLGARRTSPASHLTIVMWDAVHGSVAAARGAPARLRLRGQAQGSIAAG